MRVWVTAVLLAVAFTMLPVRAFAALTCSASAPTLDFGTITTQPLPLTNVQPNLTISCTDTSNPNTTQHLCTAINAGTGTGSTTTTRLMNSGANTVQYQIYYDSGHATGWGDNSGTNAQITDIPLNGSGTGSVNFPLYGQIPSGQSKPSGTYTSTLTITTKTKPGESGCNSGSGTLIATTTFAAQVIVQSSCTITPSGVNFGSLSTLGVAQNTSSSLSVTCTSSAPYTIAMDAGSTTGNTIAARKMALNGAGAGVVSYQLYRDSGPANVWGDGTTGVVYSGTGSGSAQTIPYYAQLPSQATPASGNYKDTVTATITF